MMGAYAKGTSVSAAKSRIEIEEMIDRFGASGFMFGRDGRQAVIAFKARDRHVMFRLLEPDPDSDEFRFTSTGKRRDDQATLASLKAEERRRWRSLTMSIKAKLVSVDDGIETFEQAFMAHVVMPDGLTMSDHVTDRIAIAYETGNMPRLLPTADREE